MNIPGLKSLLLLGFLVVGKSAVAAEPASPLATMDVMDGAVIEGQDSTDQFVRLFNIEASREGSKLAAYLTELQKSLEFGTLSDSGSSIFISRDDVLRLDSGVSAGNFSANFLLLIRANHKSSIFTVAYLSGELKAKIDSDVATYTIKAPVKVTIDDAP